MHYCAICGGYPTTKGILLCPICEHKTRDWFLPQTESCDQDWIRHEKNILQRQFDFAQMQIGFLWPPNQARAKVHLLHALKGQSCRNTWQLMAYRFVEKQRSINKIKPRRWLLLPIPSHHHHKDDHAWRWAKALAPLVGGHVLDVFRRSSKSLKQQKEHDLSQRHKMEFTLVRSELQNWLSHKSRQGWGIAVVDDVVTSGATARAAWRALGQPTALSIWALAHRITLRKGYKIRYNAASNTEH